jgi:SAM-dependent methyltransferase
MTRCRLIRATVLFNHPQISRMPSVTEHYENHLAPIYVWMAGGMEAAIARGRAEMDAVCPRPSKSQWAVDLGAGFGMHAIPLADMGYSVLAIDSCGALLAVMQGHQGSRPIKAVRDDLLSFKRHLNAPTALIVCMGDTLTHLPDQQSVEGLFADVAAALDHGGTFIVTLRDYSVALNGLNRFIPVRGDADRILTCFLEYQDGAVTVHDILHERDGSGWRQRVSAYRKLRLSTNWVARALEARGFQVTCEPGVAGMTRIIAKSALSY